MKFRKQISIMLVTFILLLNSHLLFVSHFCHDNLAYISLSFEKAKPSKDSKHGCCDFKDDVTEDKDSCCKNQKIKISKKVDLNFKKQLNINFDTIHFENNYSFDFVSFTKIPEKNNIGDYIFSSNSPPTYLKNCQLVLYA